MADFTARLETCVSALQRLMTVSATSAVAGMIYAMRMRFADSDGRMTAEAMKLHSPARQQAFLLGLMLATEEPAKPRDFGPTEWKRCVSLLNEAFGLYQQLFTPATAGPQTKQWWRAREVAGPVFMHYFNTSLIATGEQIRARIIRYCAPFDTELVAATGISASDSLRMMSFVVDTIQQHLRTMAELEPLIKQEQERFFESGDYLRRDNPNYSAFLQEHYPVLDGYFSRFARQGQIARAELQAAFPAQADAFWARYAVGRGKGPALQYPTDDSIRPVWAGERQQVVASHQPKLGKMAATIPAHAVQASTTRNATVVRLSLSYCSSFGNSWNRRRASDQPASTKTAMLSTRRF